MSCSFYDSSLVESLEAQTMVYCLSLVQEGMCNIQKNQVQMSTSTEDAQLFMDTRCSDIQLQVGFETGNADVYKYQTSDKFVDIYVYKITLV